MRGGWAKYGMKDHLKSAALKTIAAAKWLWLLPPIRSAILTNIARVGLGSTALAIISAIADGLAS